MSNADTRSTLPSPTPQLLPPPSVRKDLRSFRRDWSRWSSGERQAVTLILVFVAVAPALHLLP